MKRVLATIIALIFVFMLSSCNGTTNSVDTTDTTINMTIETSKDTTNTTAINEIQVPDSNDTTAVEDTTSEQIDSSPNVVHVTGISLDKYSVKVQVGGNDMPWVTMEPSNATNVGEIWSSSDSSIATVNSYGKIVGVSVGECTITVKSEDNPNVSAEVKVEVTEAEGLTYIQGILIANKTYSLPADYNPGIDPTAQAALNNMINAAAKDGISLWIVSAFRSYQTQATLYNNYAARDGKAEADRYSARPGYSEHQTGLAFDLNSLEQSFGETAEGKWLSANCYKYGFIIRYPSDKEDVTGYMYEPWHVRYLGIETATKVFNSGKCLEEYLGITSSYSN